MTVTREPTLSRPFPCASPPHPSRERVRASGSPALQNTAILQRVHPPRPPGVQPPETLCRLQANYAAVRDAVARLGTLSRGPEGKDAMARARYRFPGGSDGDKQNVCEVKAGDKNGRKQSVKGVKKNQLVF